MTIVRPRLTDCNDIFVSQEAVDFAIPFIDEDVPLYLDPFLLWRSPSQQDQSLHRSITDGFNLLGRMYAGGREQQAIEILIEMSECSEAGLGNGKSKRGRKISASSAKEVLELFNEIPQLAINGFDHFEVIQLYVDGVSKDRVSDISCNLLKSFLVDFTQQNCLRYKIPTLETPCSIFDFRDKKFVIESAVLPYNPQDESSIILVPKRWLRYVPWISYDDYYQGAYVKVGDEDNLEKPQILEFNRNNYDVVSAYVSEKVRTRESCRNDPLFKQIPITSAKRALGCITDLSTGKDDNADKKYEDYAARLLASLLYPHLDFAQTQCRTESGSQIRDLVFYNNCDYPFLKNLYDEYSCKQIIIEMKNVKELERDHVNQLNRYLSPYFGRFGILLTRNRPKKSIIQNIIDLWSGQRKCLLVLTDEDLKLMVNVYETKQRDPIEIVKQKYVEFLRLCPA
ncbi:MAG: GxxExxY protein [Gordonibacter sp.]|nr:GxxExxY protein [Gordonibacter sp.]